MRKTTWFAVLAALLTTIVIPGFLIGLPTAFKRQTVRAVEPDLGALVWMPPRPGRDSRAIILPGEMVPTGGILSGAAPSTLLDSLGALLGELNAQATTSGETAGMNAPEFPLDEVRGDESGDMLRALTELSLPRGTYIPSDVAWTLRTLGQIAAARALGNSDRAAAAVTQPNGVVANLANLPVFGKSTVGGSAGVKALATQASVPEPATGLLLVCGASLIAAARRWRLDRRA